MDYFQKEPSGPSLYSEPQAWAWAVFVLNPTRPLSYCHGEPKIWVQPPPPVQTTSCTPLASYSKDSDFPPHGPLGFQKHPPLGPGYPPLSPILAGTAGGQVVLPFLLTHGSLGLAPTGSGWCHLLKKGPAQQDPELPQASPEIFEVSGSQTCWHVRTT